MGPSPSARCRLLPCIDHHICPCPPPKKPGVPCLFLRSVPRALPGESKPITPFVAPPNTYYAVYTIGGSRSRAKHGQSEPVDVRQDPQSSRFTACCQKRRSCTLRDIILAERLFYNSRLRSAKPPGSCLRYLANSPFISFNFSAYPGSSARFFCSPGSRERSYN